VEDQFWSFIVQLRFSYEYLDIYYEKSRQKESTLSIILAITSSAAVATWAIWKELPFLWSAVIGVSQVISAIRPYLPWGARVERLPPLIRKMGLLSVECETSWNELQTSKSNELDYVYALAKFRKEYVEIESELHACKSLPSRKKYQELADDRKKIYFAQFYKVKEDNVMSQNEEKVPIKESVIPKPSQEPYIEHGEKRAIIPTTSQDIPRPKPKEQ